MLVLCWLALKLKNKFCYFVFLNYICNMKRKTNTKFIEECKQIHGDKYDYSKVNYVNARTKVCIICPVHGEFWQLPSLHIGQKCGCPLCNGTFKKTKTMFVEEARKVHGDKYDYSKVKYENIKKKVCIICTEHGEFWQTPYEHLAGHGCPKCSGRMKLTRDEFEQRAREIHGDKYDYSKVEYVNNSTKVCIICPEHGEFWQTASEHLRGHGCPKCGQLLVSKKKQISFDVYLTRFKEVHGDKYDYTHTIYINSLTKINIVCPEHGEFWQLPYDHCTGHGCPKCANQQSKAEEEIVRFLSENTDFKIQTRDKSILKGKELDIYIPEKKTGIEYNGLIWHSEKFGKDKNYHLDKTLECEKQGVRLIHIFENEWCKNKKIVQSKLLNILHKSNLPKIYARDCNVKIIRKENSREFLNKNHIQGSGGGSIHLGCYYNDELVGVMTFKRERKVSDKWELIRFATDINKHCVGVGGKLFTYFVRNYNPSEVKSFADRRWALDKDNNLYTKLGFKLDSILKPDYYYINNKTSFLHKFNFRKQILYKNYDLPLTMTEDEMTEKLGYYKIWDCGLFKYVWKKE